MIDEKEVIEAIEEKILEVKADKEKCEEISDFADILMDVYRGLIYFIKQQPKVGEWISCSERLPELHRVDMESEGEYYMISDSVIITDGERVSISEYEIDDVDCRGWIAHDFEEIEDVIAWMPIPEPTNRKEMNKIMKDGIHPTGYVKLEYKKQTNGDKIRAMSDEELAGSRVDRIDFYTKSDIPEYIGDFNGIANGIEEAIALEIKWLQSEAKEANNPEPCETAQPSWKDQMLRKFLGRRE